MRMTLAAVATLLCWGASALWSEVVDNQAVLRMHRAGLPGTVIIAKIHASQPSFDTSVEALVELAEAGVPSEVIAELTSVRSPASAASAPGYAAPVQQVVHSGQLVVSQKATPAANAPARFNDPHCPNPGIFVAGDDGGLQEVDPSAYSGSKTAGALTSVLSHGILSVKSKAMIQGTTSHNRVFSRSPTFYFCFEETETGLSYETAGATTPSQFILVSLDVNPKQNARLLVTGKMNRYTGGYAGPPPKYRTDFTFEKLAPGVYRVTVNGLGPGEYCFFYTGSKSATSATTYGLVTPSGGGKVFDFSVG